MNAFLLFLKFEFFLFYLFLFLNSSVCVCYRIFRFRNLLKKSKKTDLVETCFLIIISLINHPKRKKKLIVCVSVIK